MMYNKYLFFALLLSTILLNGCLHVLTSVKNYDEIPSMLNLLTNKVQVALEDGYFDKGEPAIIEYIKKKNPNVYEWFMKHKYEIKVGVVSDYAVVMVCDNGKPIFEDTYCRSGPPDKDHRGNKDLKSCEITMTVQEINNICN